MRFVILKHDHPHLHWDFMLEVDDALRAWRLAERPVCGKQIAAEYTFEHRLMYLDYEGPVSNNRGSVKRWDGGVYRQFLTADQANALELELDGGRICGRVRLTRQSGNHWIFEWLQDKEAHLGADGNCCSE